MRQPPKVLVTSRNVSTREAAATILLRDGCAVDQAADLATTLDAIEQRRPPLVFLVDATAPSEELEPLLDDLALRLSGPPRVVLLASEKTPSALRAHRAVACVLDDGSNLVGALMSLRPWIHRFEQRAS